VWRLLTRLTIYIILMTKNLVFNKQIGLAVGMIVFVVAAVIGGTGAFFSDTETSSNNVFTAGDVTLTLGTLTHTYLADGTPLDPIANYVNIDGNTKSFQFSDLKPLDWGSMNGILTNGGNPAFVCARVVAPSTATVSPFEDMLKFRVNNGLGLSVAQTLNLTGLNQWFSLNPLAPALAMASGQALPSSVQYCFGKFEAGTPGDCVIDPAVTDYNLAQGQTLRLDIEYYAVQQRNNGDFTCADMNPVPQWTDAGTRTGGLTDFIEDGANGTVLRLTTINDVDSRVRWTNMNLNYDLSTFAGVTYESKQVSAIDTVNGNASMRLFVDLDGNTLTADVREITYEPYYNIAAHNSLGPVAIVSNTWQTWYTTLADGKFWASGGFLGSVGGGGDYASNFTLAQVLAAHPSAKVVGISLGMGTNNVGQVVHVDNLVVNGASLSLEN
jgi:predicted ribosomally synthesized peptide with SipW-like signal peptide